MLACPVNCVFAGGPLKLLLLEWGISVLEELPAQFSSVERESLLSAKCHPERLFTGVQGRCILTKLLLLEWGL